MPESLHVIMPEEQYTKKEYQSFTLQIVVVCVYPFVSLNLKTNYLDFKKCMKTLL